MKKYYDLRPVAMEISWESISILTNRITITRDLKNDLQDAVRQNKACALCTRSTRAREAFEDIAWDDLNCTIKTKPQMYQTWLAKQTKNQ